MNIKKLTALLCAVVMVLSLAACGSDSGDKASGSQREDHDHGAEQSSEFFDVHRFSSLKRFRK